MARIRTLVRFFLHCNSLRILYDAPQGFQGFHTVEAVVYALVEGPLYLKHFPN
jgi:hypothetical protein